MQEQDFLDPYTQLPIFHHLQLQKIIKFSYYLLCQKADKKGQ